MNTGVLVVYTGDGKGKTTAGLGSALRAYGRGMKVAVFYFLKDSNQGELSALRNFPVLIISFLGVADLSILTIYCPQIWNPYYRA